MGDRSAGDRLAIKLVVVTMFDPPESAVGWPSELTHWVERLPLPERLPFPLGERDLRLNRAKAVLAVVTGVGNTRAAASIMALGLDPRFDLRAAYWLVAGIAGANPQAVPLGGAAWVDWIVDGDLAGDIDAREIPADWPTGRLPLGKSLPYQEPASTLTATMAWQLDPTLVEWAHKATRAAAPDIAIVKGAVLASNSLWHGALLNRWAEEWVRYWTSGAARFAVSAMEDAGIVLALRALAKAGHVDARRLLVLRTGSNFNVPPDGISAAASLGGEMRDGFSAYVPALEAAWRVGSIVANDIIDNWDKWRERT